jgi:hypothetical protein
MARPRIYETAEELQKEVDRYFDSTPQSEIAISGLAYHLGFADRQSLYDYEKDDRFSCIIKRARLRVELAYEWRLNSNTCTGAIFALKNMGWRDRQEVESHGSLSINWIEERTYEADEKAD